MKHLNNEKLNTAIFALFLAFAVASSAYASEITGTLRSSGDNKPQAREEESAPDAKDNSVSGSVVSDRESNSGSSTTTAGSSTSRTSSAPSGSSTSSPAYENSSTPQSSGEVLGASRTPNPTTSDPSSLRSSSGSLSPSPSSHEELVAEENSAFASPYFTLEDEPNRELSPALSPILNAGSWFWIIMISLFLVATLAYYLTRPTDELERV